MLRRATELSLRAVILLLAAFELLVWAHNLLLHFVRPLSEIFDSAWGLLRIFGLLIFPTCAAVAGVLAILGRRLGLAAILVAVQPLVYAVAIVTLMIMGVTGPSLRLAP